MNRLKVERHYSRHEASSIKRVQRFIIFIPALCRPMFSVATAKFKNTVYPCYFITYCWRALARQLPILYNSEKAAKSVGCKIEDMRSRLCFLYPGIPGCL